VLAGYSGFTDLNYKEMGGATPPPSLKLEVLMAKIKVEITKGRIFNGKPCAVGDKMDMDEIYFKVAGKRFSKKIGASKEIKTEDESLAGKQTKKKKNEDKEMVGEGK